MIVSVNGVGVTHHIVGTINEVEGAFCIVNGRGQSFVAFGAELFMSAKDMQLGRERDCIVVNLVFEACEVQIDDRLRGSVGHA